MITPTTKFPLSSKIEPTQKGRKKKPKQERPKVQSGKSASLYVDPELWDMLKVVSTQNTNSRSMIVDKLIRDFLVLETARRTDLLQRGIEIVTGDLKQKIDKLRKLQGKFERLLTEVEDFE